MTSSVETQVTTKSTVFHYVSGMNTKSDENVKDILNNASKKIEELGAELKLDKQESMLQRAMDFPGVTVDSDDPKAFKPTQLRKAIERAPPLHDRPPLVFEPFSRQQLEAAFTLQPGGIDETDIQALAEAKLLAKQEKKRKRAEKKEKKEKKRAKKSCCFSCQFS